MTWKSCRNVSSVLHEQWLSAGSNIQSHTGVMPVAKGLFFSTDIYNCYTNHYACSSKEICLHLRNQEAMFSITDRVNNNNNNNNALLLCSKHY